MVGQTSSDRETSPRPWKRLRSIRYGVSYKPTQAALHSYLAGPLVRIGPDWIVTNDPLRFNASGACIPDTTALPGTMVCDLILLRTVSSPQETTRNMAA